MTGSVISLGALVTAALMGGLGGLASCDSTAKFTLPDTKFADVQVVSAFPTLYDNSKAGAPTLSRVCGRNLDKANGTEVTPNSVSFVVNFLSTERKKTRCSEDLDVSIKEGELIELTRVIANGVGAVFGSGNFKVSMECVEPRAGTSATTPCKSGVSGIQQSTDDVRYQNISDRCDPARDETRLNVALIVDRSGSTSGFVSKYLQPPLGTDAKCAGLSVPGGSGGCVAGVEDKPGVQHPSNFGDFASDPKRARIVAAQDFVSQLNARDRVIGYYFDEDAYEGGEVMCSNDPGEGQLSNDVLNIPNNDNGVRARETYCFGPRGAPWNYGPDANGDPLTYGDLIKNSLEKVVKYPGDSGNGRAPLWSAVYRAYTFFTDENSPVQTNRHLVVIADGPDTCLKGESYRNRMVKDLTGSTEARTECQKAKKGFDALRARIDQDATESGFYPVAIHIIQFQSMGYQEPDAAMMEIACRTGGTYQFINSEEMNKSEPNTFITAMKLAVTKVRYALGGYWLVTTKLGSMEKEDIQAGVTHAIDGSLRFEKFDTFPSLEAVFTESDTKLPHWLFSFLVLEDTRLLFRKSCVASADCRSPSDTGDAECGPKHCDAAGECRPNNAPDGLPCGGTAGGSTGKECCNGSCNPGVCAGS